MGAEIFASRYAVLRPLGEGASGRVYLVEDLAQEGRRLALKVVERDRADGTPTEYLRREFEALAAVCHPHLLEVHDLIEANRGARLFYTAEFVDGPDLFAATAACRAPAPDPAAWTFLYALAGQIAGALEAVHRAGYVHFDVKPANILVANARGPRPAAKLLDFGFALHRASGERSGFRGTIPYMAPEVIRGEPTDARTDLYSLGATIFAVVAGRPPFIGTEAEVERAHVEVEPPLLGALNPHAPPGLEKAIARLLRKDPSERYASAEEFARSLALLTGAPVAVEFTGSVERRLLAGGVVGRAAERAALDAAIAPPAAPQAPRVLSITGETGAGKTRLLRLARARAQRAGLVTVDLDPFAPGGLRETVRRAALALASAKGTSPRGRALANRLRADLEHAGAPPDAIGSRLGEALLRAGIPTLVAADDFDRADEDFALALERAVRTIVARGPAARDIVVVVAGARTGTALAAVQTLALEPLPRAEIVRLCQNALGRAPAPDEPLAARADPVRRRIRRLGAWIEATVGGTPLRIEECLRTLAERGAIFTREDGLDVDLERARKVDLPRGTSEAFAARLDALDGDVRAAVEALSVCGSPADLGLLAATAGLPSDRLWAALERLLALGIVSNMRRPALRHEALGAVAAARLPPGRAAALHDKAAEFLEANGGSPAAIAGHRLAGRAPGAHLERALEASRDLVRTFDLARARTLLERLVPLVKRDRPSLAPAALEELGRVEEFAGRAGRACEHYEAALAALGETGAPVDRGRLLMRAGHAFLSEGRLAEARLWLLRCLRALPRDENAVRAHALSHVAALAVRRRRPTAALRPAERGFRRLAALPEGPERAAISARLANASGLALEARGDRTDAAARFEVAVEAARASGDWFAVGTMVMNLARARRDAGDRRRARGLFRNAIRIARRHGFARLEANARANRAIFDWHAGALARASRGYRQARELFEAAGDLDWAVRTTNNLAFNEWFRGAYAESLTLFRGALERAATPEQRLRAHLGAGLVLATIGERDRAAAEADAAQAMIDAVRDPSLEAELLELRARIARERGLPRDALAAFERARALRAGAKGYDAAALALERADALLDVGGPDAARTAWREANALVRDAGVAGLRARAAYVRGRIEVAAGRDEPARRALVRALALAPDEADIDRAWRAAHLLGRSLASGGESVLGEAYRARAAAILRGIMDRLPAGTEAAFARRDGVADALAAARPARAGPGNGTSPDAAAGVGLDLARDLLEINRALAQEHELRPLLAKIMDAAVALVRAERGFIVLAGGKGGMSFAAGRDIGREDIRRGRLKISRSIAKRVLASGKPVVARDARREDEWATQRSVLELELASVLCVPLRLKEKTIGVLYLDHRYRASAFGPEHVHAIEAFADQAALAIHNARLLDAHARARREVEDLNRRLEERLARRDRELGAIERTLQGREDGSDLRFRYENIVGRSAPMVKLLKLVDHLTELPYPVLILGESGTGKELVARAIHYHGPRRSRPFVAVNCASFSESLLEAELFGVRRGAFTGAIEDRVGLLEVSSGGTLFLDEIGDMSLGMQTKLLRALELGEVQPVGGTKSTKLDLRIIAATNKDLRAEVKAGRFREDFFFRLCVLEVFVPPLRERREDIPLLLAHYLERIALETKSPRKEISPEAIDVLCAYDWPGNVRELRSELQRASAATPGTRIEVAALSPQVRGRALDPVGRILRGPIDSTSLAAARREADRRVIVAALAQTAGNRSQAARLLGVSRFGLLKLMQRCGID